MGILNFLKGRKQDRIIRDVENRVSGFAASQMPKGLALLGEAHGKAGNLDKAAHYFSEAAKEAKKIPMFKGFAPRFREISKDYQMRMAMAV